MSDLFTPLKIPTSLVKFSPDTKYSWEHNPSVNGFDLFLEGGVLTLSEKFFPDKISERTVAYLQENDWHDWRTVDWSSVNPEQLDKIRFRNISWKQDCIKFFGKTLPLPRLTSWYGDPGASYKYSGIQSDPNPWNKGLLYLREKIEQSTGYEFNSVLLNWYRNGLDSLNWHADDERELGENPVIASASFGANRDFLFKNKYDERAKIKISLPSGSLVIMRGDTQDNWVHSVPKRKTVTRSRFNLTFRKIIADL